MQLSQESVERAMRRAGIEAPARYEPVVDSTNARAMAWAAAGAPEWAVVAAGHQTAGRGRLGRRWWDSEPGASLLFSMVLRPSVPAERAGVLSLLAAVAVAEATRDAGGPPLTCKWPNDVLRDQRKAGGILVEASTRGDVVRHVVVGVGVNLAAPPPDVPGAAGLDDLDPEPLLSAFLHRFAEAYRLAPDRLAEHVLQRYRPLSSTIGRRVRARTIEGATVEGIATDVDERGNLVLETGDGSMTVGFGEIRHLD